MERQYGYGRYPYDPDLQNQPAEEQSSQSYQQPYMSGGVTYSTLTQTLPMQHQQGSISPQSTTYGTAVQGLYWSHIPPKIDAPFPQHHGQYQSATEQCFDADHLSGVGGPLEECNRYGNANIKRGSSFYRDSTAEHVHGQDVYVTSDVDQAMQRTVPTEGEYDDGNSRIMNEPQSPMPTHLMAFSGSDTFQPSTSPSPSSGAQEQATRESVECPDCGQILTGPYGVGNLTRHQKSLKCPSSKSRRKHLCRAEGCGKGYQRSDGLLNHMRKRHNAPGPSRRT